MNLFILVLNLNILEIKRRARNTVKKTPEEDGDEIVYLGTQPEDPRNRF